MPAQWGNYFCNVNDKLASIALDLSLRPSAPNEGKPWLLWTWVYLRFPKPNGLSDSVEFDVICAIEDELAKHIGTACDAVEAGRITTDGRREFYFYGAHEKGFKSAASKAMGGFKEYKLDLGSQEDAAWNQYLTVLYPSEESLEKMKNQDVLDVLMKHGDTLKAVRDVHHWVYFRTRDDRQWFASAVSEIGYAIERESEKAGSPHPLGLQITRDQSVTPAAIDDAVVELFRLAKQVDAEYDGWEAQVITVKN